MSADRIMFRFATLLAASGLLLATAADAGAQTSAGQPANRTRAARARSAEAAFADADHAAGGMLDALFSSEPPADPLAEAATQAMGVTQSKAARRGSVQGTLVHNPDQADGNPPYALADRYGGVIRYVEPVKGVDLDRYVGQNVTAVRDTGHTLLASQLQLPRMAPKSGVMLAQHAEELPAGEPEAAIEEGAPLIVPEGQEPLYLDDGLDFHEHRMGTMGAGCPHCGSMLCPPNGCGFGSRPILYARVDYMLMWAKGMDTPPLVVRGEVDDNDTPTDPTDDMYQNVFTVYGGQQILKRERSGGRIIAGTWLDDYGQLAVEGEYFSLGQISERFVDGGNGTVPIVARPFIDATTGLDAFEDVSFPGTRGTVTVDSNSQIQSAGLRLRRNLCCISGCGPDCGDCVGCGSGVSGAMWLDDPFFPFFARGSRHVDLIAGVRWMQLQENLQVVEDLETYAPLQVPGTFLLTDRFSTTNEFVGGELGFQMDWRHQRWSMELLSKIGVGNTHQHVGISGSTIRDRGTVDETFKEGGLLTQTTNIGSYDRNVFSVVPEIGVTLGYDVTQHLRFNVGYTFIYWSRVARPGDQIDLEVNPGLLDYPTDPGYVAPGPPNRPQFVFRDTDLWLQGVTLGFMYQY